MKTSRVTMAAVAMAAALTLAMPIRADAAPWPMAYADRATGFSSAAFAAEVRAILADRRSWRADYTGMRIILTTADETWRYCAYTDRSCALANNTALILIDRWLHATPEYLELSTLAAYRAYVINHEVGHLLGYIHMDCPAPAEPAPIMQPQTQGLLGCLPNSWPYPTKGRQ